MAARYLLAGARAGFDFAALTQVDCPPNALNHRYTEFRCADGSLHAVIRTDLLLC